MLLLGTQSIKAYPAVGKAALILPAEHEFEKQLLLSIRLYD